MTEPSARETPHFRKDCSAEINYVLQGLYRVHKLIAVIPDLDTLLLQVAEESCRVAGAEASSLLLHDPATDELYFRVAIGQKGDQETLKREVRLKMGEGIAGATAASRTTMVVENAQEDPRFFSRADDTSKFETRNILAVPMVDRDQLVGVLEVINKQGESTFSELDVQVMEMFSSLAAAAVTNARLIEEKMRTERLAAIGQAVTGLSHYTKNIVSNLSSSSDLIDMGLEAGRLDVIGKSWPVFKRSTKRISNFVQDMLSFSKPRKPLREECRIEDIIGEALETFRELFIQKAVAVELDMGGVRDAVLADPEGLYRCFLNLLTNAADAVPAENGQVVIRAETLENGDVEICIEDNGPGVPEQNRSVIFDPFFSTKGSRGTGLGLAVTEKIIGEHGGSIAVESRPRGGALFRVFLPVFRESDKDWIIS
jgi:signal transduction histidine kinase